MAKKTVKTPLTFEQTVTRAVKANLDDYMVDDITESVLESEAIRALVMKAVKAQIAQGVK